MNKNGFVQIITHHNEINEQALKSLKSLGSKYPYSEVVHVMIAKGVSLQNHGKPGKELNIAALYSTDRSILKNVLVEKAPAPAPPKAPIKTVSKPPAEAVKKSPAPPVKKVTTPPVKKVADATVKKETTTPAKKSVGTQTKQTQPVIKKKVPDKKAVDWSSEAHTKHELEMEALRKELIENLHELKKSREHLNEIIEHSGTPKKKTTKSSTAGKKKAAPKKAVKKTANSSPSTTITESKTSKVEPKNKDPKKDEVEVIDDSTIDTLIENLETKRKEENENQENKGSQSDLSVPSVEFGDDLVSENLAKIMIKQGKNAKAIDIYKKLIWKFPQKKAYFASQIENLKEE